jgi:guanylate kinase
LAAAPSGARFYEARLTDGTPIMAAQPRVIIVSGPSGVGKSTVVRRVLKECGLPLRLSVSATTRAPRAGEQDGVHYYFWTLEHFRQEVEAGHFLEWAEVVGNWYGTPLAEIQKAGQEGCGVILDIDVQGAAQMRTKMPACLSIFLFATSLEEYEKRLRARGTETEESIARRLANARRELEHRHEYTYQVENEDLDVAVHQVCGLVKRHFEALDKL